MAWRSTCARAHGATKEEFFEAIKAVAVPGGGVAYRVGVGALHALVQAGVFAPLNPPPAVRGRRGTATTSPPPAARRRDTAPSQVSPPTDPPPAGDDHRSTLRPHHAPRIEQKP